MIKTQENNGKLELTINGQTQDLIAEYVVITQKLYEAMSEKMGEVISEGIVKSSAVRGIALAKQKSKDNPPVPEMFIHDPRRHSK